VKTVTLVIAIAAVAAAGYAIYCGQQQLDRLEKLEESTSMLEASIGGVIENIREREALQPVPVDSTTSGEFQERVTGMEERLAALEASPQTGRSSKEILAEGAREMIRKIVREEQAQLIEEQEQKKTAKREKMQANMEEHFEKMRENQKKRLEEWIKKFSDKTGITIAQEQGILDAYKWASEERNRQMREKHQEGDMVMFGPEMFKEISDKRDEKIREVLSAAQFDKLEKYRSNNPFPEMAFFGAVGEDGGAMDATVIMGAMPAVKTEKKDGSEQENKDK
jgi:hypothetical protein